MKISQYKAPGTPLVDLFTVTPANILSGWSIENTGFCSTPLRWSPDFTLLLASGNPPGSQISHVAVVDVKAATFTDITAPRQKNGFSDPVLNESDPIFLADSTGSKVSFGSNMVMLRQFSGSTLNEVVVDRRTPDKQVVIPGGNFDGHPELSLKGTNTRDYRNVSPDGAYIAEGFGVVSAANPAQVIHFNCDTQRGALMGPYGWTDANHVIVSDDWVAYLVTVSPTPTCAPLIPKTGKNVSQVRLSDDGAKLYFKASNNTGTDTGYSVPANAPGTEPQPDTLVETNPAGIFGPGNF